MIAPFTIALIARWQNVLNILLAYLTKEYSSEKENIVLQKNLCFGQKIQKSANFVKTNVYTAFSQYCMQHKMVLTLPAF